MRDVGLADRLRAKALNVVEVAGWKTRGGELSSSPRGAGNHHTAGARTGEAPSLNTVIYGRRTPTVVDGPLANTLQGRHPSHGLLDPVFVVAAGRANHGGVGEWLGHSGNSLFLGNEVEHPGTEPVHPDRLEVAARICAAFCEAPGSMRSSLQVWQHFEYARPLGRKIDFFDLWPWNPSVFRTRVRFWIGRTATGGTDVLDNDDKEWLKKEIRDAVSKNIVRLGHFLTTGSQNQLFTPGHAYDVQDWIADANRVVTLDELAAQLVQVMAQDMPILVQGDTSDWWVIEGNTRSLTEEDRAMERAYVGDLFARPTDDGLKPWPWPQLLIESVPQVV